MSSDFCENPKLTLHFVDNRALLDANLQAHVRSISAFPSFRQRFAVYNRIVSRKSWQLAPP